MSSPLLKMHEPLLIPEDNFTEISSSDQTFLFGSLKVMHSSGMVVVILTGALALLHIV